MLVKMNNIIYRRVMFHVGTARVCAVVQALGLNALRAALCQVTDDRELRAARCLEG